jgi:hypothetical protein
MIRSICVALALACAAGGVALAAEPATIPIALEPQNGSKIGGTASIVHGVSPHNVVVTITLDGVFIPENRYPAGVYRGTCAALSAEPAYVLTPVMGGRSKTNLRVKPPLPGSYALAVFNTSGKKTMSCGMLPPMKHGTKPHDKM